jgi:hypothetical protein
MEKAKNIFRWIYRNFFFISFATFFPFYVRRFWLLPSKEGLFSGIIWIFILVCIAVILRIKKYPSWMVISLFVYFIFFSAANVLNIYFNVLRIDDYAKYNGVRYYIVSYPHYFDPPWRIYNFTEWSGLFRFKSQQIDHAGLKIRYDEKMGLVSLVSIGFDGQEQLVFTDSDPPREYGHIFAQNNRNLYYISPQCNQGDDGYFCIYTLYQCEMDNTSCVLIPFRYTSRETYAYLKFNETTDEIDVYIAPTFGDDFLIYSYGDHPRCYVDGCEILESP